MRMLWVTLTGTAFMAAVLAGSSAAVTQSPSGDTCTASGGGTAYSLTITIPSAGPTIGGFAFGAPGATVTNIAIPGTGTLSTLNLPANTSGAWVTGSPLLPGSIVATLATSGPIKGPFKVIGMNPAGGFYDPIPCALGAGTSPSNVFTVTKHFTYQTKTHTWQTLVTVPGPGRVSFAASVATSSSGGSEMTGQSSLYPGKVVAQGAGQVKVVLRPTATGLKALASGGSIKTQLTITFTPKGGKTSSKQFGLSLKTAV